MEDVELLERARRLCLAARQLELPVLLPSIGRSVAQREEKEGTTLRDEATPEDDELIHRSSSKDSQRQPRVQLPLIATPPTVPPPKRHKKQNEDKEKLALEEARRLDEKKRQERELEKIRQAQERARARVARTSQLEQQQTLRAAEQQQSDTLSAAEECARKTKRAQKSRRLVNERIRMKRQVQTPETTQRNATPGTRTEPDKLKLFPRKTMRRLQASSPQTGQRSKIDRADTPERNDDIEFVKKLMERKCRQETAARLRRMKQMADNQKRQEQEEFEQGLQKFKNKLREMDRVAKGLSRQPPSPQNNEPALHRTEEVREEIFPSSADLRCHSPVRDEMMLALNQDGKSFLDSDEANNARSPARYPVQTEVPSPRTEVYTHRRKSRCKVPVWKQPPVPLQPTECYSYKAIIPTYSRISITAPGHSNAATLGSETRLRAQEISRQMK